MPDVEHPIATAAQLWEQDRALLAKHGPSHIESICAVARGLRAEGREEEAAELDRQCARMRILAMPNAELLALYERTEGVSGDELAALFAAEIEHRGLDT
ncbi:MAG: hypothetical protein JWN66_2841 [Sphingomonas bacterium]|uniref:hypothetical protein n=1 Tax=Sphingomonas bacterium TaxID=1895847 RepID=UPI00260DF85F|nr:hypothetical protein [Sphingomonas bacterium]MDB5705725.1 hypothetical protein [Sphingomonas bacterium]